MIRWWRARRAAQRAHVLAAVMAHPGAERETLRRCAGVGWYALGVHLAELRADGEIESAGPGGRLYAGRP